MTESERAIAKVCAGINCASAVAAVRVIAGQRLMILKGLDHLQHILTQGSDEKIETLIQKGNEAHAKLRQMEDDAMLDDILQLFTV